MQAMSRRTHQDIYLEFTNDWLTVEAMAENYNQPRGKMESVIEKGRLINELMAERLNGLDSLELTPEEIEEGRQHLESLSIGKLSQMLARIND